VENKNRNNGRERDGANFKCSDSLAKKTKPKSKNKKIEGGGCGKPMMKKKKSRKSGTRRRGDGDKTTTDAAISGAIVLNRLTPSPLPFPLPRCPPLCVSFLSPSLSVEFFFAQTRLFCGLFFFHMRVRCTSLILPLPFSHTKCSGCVCVVKNIKIRRGNWQKL